MSYYGVYHADYQRVIQKVWDAPCVSRGRMTLCAEDIASQGDLMAMADGHMRNRRRLAEKLDCSAGVSAAHLVLKAYMKWGEDYPKYIEGAVVTCLMDASRDMMVLSRDPMGQKRLFYAGKAEATCFADHPDVLLKTDSASPVMDADGLRELFGMGPARTPGRTYYREIKMLEPGCSLILNGEGMRIQRYFQIEDIPHEENEAMTIEHTRALLEQAMDEVLKINPAVMLSGGLDSTALTALLYQHQKRILSFSVDYRDNGRDFSANAFRPEMDAPYVEMAVRAFKTQHRTVILEQNELAKTLGKAVSLRGFPGMADIDSSLWLFSRQIGRYAGDVVSGECGDEVFCGYPWFRGECILPETAFPWSGSLELRQILLRPEIRQKLHLQEYVSDVYRTRVRLATPANPSTEKDGRLKIMQRLCFDYFMPNLQERALCMGEGAGIRVWTPLADERLATYIYNVPHAMKFMGGIEKGLFREAVRDILPEHLRMRKKSPYPKTCSPVYGDIVRRLAMKMASDTEAPIFEWVDPQRVVAIAQSDLDPVETPWYGQLMAGAQLLGYLWQINLWMRQRNITFQG